MTISETDFNLQSRLVEMAKCSKGNNFKSWKPRFMVHVFCTSSHSALHLYEIS